MFDRILKNAPATFSAAQWRAFLRALINADPYAFTDDVAAHFVGDDENNQQTAEEVLLSTINELPDDKLTGFALRLALTGHAANPREIEIDFLAEAATAFAPAKSTCCALLFCFQSASRSLLIETSRSSVNRPRSALRMREKSAAAMPGRV